MKKQNVLFGFLSASKLALALLRITLNIFRHLSNSLPFVVFLALVVFLAPVVFVALIVSVAPKVFVAPEVFFAP